MHVTIAPGEFFGRLGTHYFWTHFHLGETRANRPFVQCPQELLNPELHDFYNPEDYAWLCNAIHPEGKDMYIADFDEQGAYSCRIPVPGMSEIYPVEDLEWENNSIGN